MAPKADPISCGGVSVLLCFPTAGVRHGQPNKRSAGTYIGPPADVRVARGEIGVGRNEPRSDKRLRTRSNRRIKPESANFEKSDPPCQISGSALHAPAAL